MPTIMRLTATLTAVANLSIINRAHGRAGSDEREHPCPNEFGVPGLSTGRPAWLADTGPSTGAQSRPSGRIA